MKNSGIDRPVFFIGMPRSGTTILFEAFSRHPQLAWLSNYCRMWPTRPAANVLRRLLDNRFIRLSGHKKQYGKTWKFNVLLPQPDEAYEFWDHYCGMAFSRDALVGKRPQAADAQRVREAVAAVARWQGKKRFAAKLTGPPRVAYLSAVFPDAKFVHVVRDGRAVVHSLLNVPFWRQKGGFDGPFWRGLLQAHDIECWNSAGNDPGVLAALQWRRVQEVAAAESAALPDDRLMTVTYENFTAAPHDVLNAIIRFCGLQAAVEPSAWIECGARLRNMNDKFRRDFSPDYIDSLDAVLAASSREPLALKEG